MKKRIFSLLLAAVMLTLCIGLMSGGAFAADAYDLEVNGTTVTAENAGSLLPDAAITYDSASSTYILTVKNTIGSALTITSGENVRLTGDLSSTGALVSGTLTINATGDVTLENGSGGIVYKAATSIKGRKITALGDNDREGSDLDDGYLFGGTVSIEASGDVELENESGWIANGKLTIADAQEVRIRGNKNGMLTFGLDIDANGDISLSNTAGGIGGSTADSNTIKGRNITATGNYSNGNLFYGETNIEAIGDVRLENGSGGILYKAGISIKGQKITALGDNDRESSDLDDGYLFGGAVSIEAAGDVTLENESGWIANGKLTIADAQEVSIRGNKNGVLTFGLDIDANGDISLSNTAGGISSSITGGNDIRGRNITVAGNYSNGNLFYGETNIEASDAVSLINHGTGNVAGASLAIKTKDADLRFGAAPETNITVPYAKATIKVSTNADGSGRSTWNGEDPSDYKYLEIKAAKYTENRNNSLIPLILNTNFTLSFDTNGGNRISPITRIQGAFIELNAYTPVREDYEFTGWYADAALTRRVSFVTLGGNKTVYAGWKRIETLPEIDDAARWENPFADVSAYDWFYGDVRFVNESRLMFGTTNTHFDPYITTTRGMIVSVLYRLEGEPMVYGACPFDDVGSGSYYEKAIAWAAANGIVKGYSEDAFGPEDNITREQMTAILYRYAEFKGYDVSGRASLAAFADADAASAYALDSVRWAIDAGLISGMHDGTLAPQSNATRAQIAAILHRFAETFVK